MYFEVSSQAGRIQRRRVNGSTNVFVTQFSGPCYGLFIDVANTLYCSLKDNHLVSSVSLNTNSSTITTRAGTGFNGSTMRQLNAPWGIFVDINLDLYVADAGNNRIQRFTANNFTATTVAGRGFPNGLNLSHPTNIVLDGSNHLYVADHRQHRVVRVTSLGYQCLAGCSGVAGSASNQFSFVFSLRFDSYGNLYVADEQNFRIQKLTLTYNCEGRSVVLLLS